MRRLLHFTLFLIVILFHSCEKDSSFLSTNNALENSKQYSDVTSELWPFWQAFEEEAKIRGLNIDLEESGVVGEIVEIDEDHVAGSCSIRSNGSNTNRLIRIDRTIWNGLPTLFKEFIVFHELGHCILFRGHDESSDSAGICLSIMRSGVDGCRDGYNSQTRDFYIDELFENF